MRPITADQSQQVMAALTTKINWSEIDFEALNLQMLIICNPEAGENFMAFLKNGGQVEASCQPKTNLLEFIGTTIPANTNDFVARDCLIVNTSDDAPVKISWLSDKFRKNFLSKVEKPMAEGEVSYYNLLELSADKLIIAELGGETKGETSLSEMFSQMKKQPKGEKGDLLTNGHANIFYIRDTTGVLWAVDCYWFDVGWCVDAYSVEGPGEWDVGDRVFSRKSLES